FPPRPLSAQTTVSILSDFCDALSLDSIEEYGCAVCGQLTRLLDLVPLAEVNCSLTPLVENGLVRIERRTNHNPIRFADGPVVDPSCNSACTSCVKSLRNGKRPVEALANGVWIGAVPSVLSNLTYAEQCLIARVRCNRYVVRIWSGQWKLMGNAISFPSPTMKVYQLLPPKREELDDVLAFIFTGVKPPTDEDLARTPMLVRRKSVAKALDWLKLNHSDYTDLQIDRDALNSYPECGIPVSIEYRKSQSSTNVDPSATSMHEVNDEE
ncbi:hypothetical protein DFP72DRAFT_780758, partial [Ephemerocybe angulata]